MFCLCVCVCVCVHAAAVLVKINYIYKYIYIYTYIYVTLEKIVLECDTCSKAYMCLYACMCTMTACTTYH